MSHTTVQMGTAGAGELHHKRERERLVAGYDAILQAAKDAEAEVGRVRGEFTKHQQLIADATAAAGPVHEALQAAELRRLDSQEELRRANDAMVHAGHQLGNDGKIIGK